MKPYVLLMLAFGLAAGAAARFSSGNQERSQPQSVEQLGRAVRTLQEQVQALRADVDGLLESKRYNQEEIRCLEELVQAREATHQRVFELSKIGARGGETWNEAMARYRMSVAKARLAWAKRNLGECQKAREAAVSAAEKQMEALQAAHETGMVTLECLLEAQAQLARAKIDLSRIKRAIAREQVRR